MAYAALISARNTIERLLNCCHISIVQNSSSEIISLLHNQVVSLEQVIEELNYNIDEKTKLDNRLSLKALNNLDQRIRAKLHKVEDVIETLVSKEFHAQYGQDHEVRSSSSLLLLDLQEWRQDFDSLTIMIKKMEDHIRQLNYFYNHYDRYDDDDAYYDYSSSSDDDDDGLSDDDEYVPIEDDDEDEDEDDSSHEEDDDFVRFDDDDDDEGSKYKSELVGLSNTLSIVRQQLLDPSRSEYGTVSLCGMGGIGKTTLAKQLMEDPLVKKHFQCRVFVRVGPERRFVKFLKQMHNFLHNNKDGTSIYEDMVSDRFILVLDDVWSLDALTSLKNKVPYLCDGNIILVTTRIGNVAESASFCVFMPFLTSQDSWILLRDRVFGENDCPRALEKPGRKIAEVCAGLPLTIITVAKILSSSEKTAEYWNQVAAKQNSVLFDAYEKMSKVLLPSYTYLPQHLKGYFLYFGILPENDAISRSKLINLWGSEGFVPTNLGFLTIDRVVTNCLEELVSRNVVIRSLSDYDTDKYHLIPPLLHLCVREAQKAKFLHVLNHYVEDAAQVLKGQRRLCTHNNVLFAIKELRDSMSSASTVRSLLCTGPYHQYPVPICFDLTLLRVLDALTVRFYEFPLEVLKLFHLRYFAMTCDAELSASISTLWNLECLIVNKHTSMVESSGNPSYLPMEIWEMKQLKHLQIMGSDLPDPNEEESLLPNLLTLLDVGIHSCTKRILERIPNLKRLGIRIELSPDNVEPGLSCFDHMSHLVELEMLKCVIVNPIFAIAQPSPLPIFPRLMRLSLSGCGYPWEEIRVIGSLGLLKVLTLRCYAFRGPKWETRDGEFPSLKYLSIEDTDLIVWKIGDASFKRLSHIVIKHCYKLEEIEGDLGRVREIEVVDCSSAAVKQISHIAHHARIHSSWEDIGKYKLEEIGGDLGRVVEIEAFDCFAPVKQIAHITHARIRSSSEDGKHNVRT